VNVWGICVSGFVWISPRVRLGALGGRWEAEGRGRGTQKGGDAPRFGCQRAGREPGFVAKAEFSRRLIVGFGVGETNHGERMWGVGMGVRRFPCLGYRVVDFFGRAVTAGLGRAMRGETVEGRGASLD
jgi:hypothetical protein